MRVQAYQRNGRRVEDLAAHRVDNLQLARQAHVGDEGAQGAALQAGQRLGLGRRHRGGDATVCLLAHIATQVPQVVDVLGVNGQLVRGRGLSRAFRMGPARLCPRARPHDVVRIGPRQVRREGYVEGQIDLRAWGDYGRGGRGRRRSLDRSCDGHLVVRPGEGKAGRGRHLFPTVAGLAREVGDLVHGDGEEGALGDEGDGVVGRGEEREGRM